MFEKRIVIIHEVFILGDTYFLSQYLGNVCYRKESIIQGHFYGECYFPEAPLKSLTF